MKVCLYCDADEPCSNIGIAKALTEMLDTDALREIEQYLWVFVTNNSVDKGVGRKEE